MKIIAADPDFAVLHIADVPRDWTEVSLRMTLPKSAGKAAREFEPVQIYVNDKIVASVTEITEKDLIVYKRQAYQSKIQAYSEQIQLLQRQVKATTRSIREADAKVAEIQSKMEYQTEREKEESNDLIDELLAKKENLTREKEEQEKEIKELQEKIVLQKQVLDKLQDQTGDKGTVQTERQENRT